MWPRTGIAFVTIAWCAAILTAAPAGAAAGFGDVAADEFYTPAVQWMVDNEITAGTTPGCFSPDNATTRAQVATFIHRAHGQPASGSEPFVDVGPDDYFADAVAWMVAEGITTGTTAITFDPHRLVTRGELAAFIHRAQGQPASGSEPFVDVGPDDYFADAVAWMVAEGITTGTTPTTFEPNRHVTRGEVATFLYRVAGEPRVKVAPGGVCPFMAEATALDLAEATSFDLLNELRVGLGLRPLVRDGVMDAYARDWSATMDATGVFEHSWGPYAENIAWWSAGYASPEEAAQRLHDLWVDSEGHYRNMTRASNVSIGVGFWQSDDGGWHATHVFRSS